MRIAKRLALTISASLLTLALSACDEPVPTTPALPTSVVGPTTAGTELPGNANVPIPTATTAAVEPAAIEPGPPPPDWVTGKTSYIDESGVRFGVGEAHGIKNPSLARLTAENRARAEIAKLVATQIEVVEGDGTKKVKAYATTLTGVEIIDHHVDPKTGRVYALAKQVP